jgi:hypothetical protein
MLLDAGGEFGLRSGRSGVPEDDRISSLGFARGYDVRVHRHDDFA